MIRCDGPIAHARALSDEREILDGYRAACRARACAAAAPSAPQRGTPPLVSAIVPYYRRVAVCARRDRVAGRRRLIPRLEIVLVNDGSFEEEDWVVAELAAQLPVVVVSQMNQGPGRGAESWACSQSRGRYVFPLDADNMAEPEFVARCVEILERSAEVAYVTSWSRYIGEDGAPRPGADVWLPAARQPRSTDRARTTSPETRRR